MNDCQVECIESGEESMRRMCLQLILMAKYADKHKIYVVYNIIDIIYNFRVENTLKIKFNWATTLNCQHKIKNSH